MITRFLQPQRFRLSAFSENGTGWWYSYYLRPWALADDLFREARAILHRGLFGWDRSDVWSLDRTLAHTIAAQLRYLAQHHHGIPVSFSGTDFSQETSEAERADRDVSWMSWLNARAQAFDDYCALMEHDYWDSLVSWEEWTAFLKAHPKDWLQAESPYDRVPDVEWERARQIWEARMAATMASMRALFDHWESLWD